MWLDEFTNNKDTSIKHNEDDPGEWQWLLDMVTKTVTDNEAHDDITYKPIRHLSLLTSWWPDTVLLCRCLSLVDILSCPGRVIILALDNVGSDCNNNNSTTLIILNIMLLKIAEIIQHISGLCQVINTHCFSCNFFPVVSFLFRQYLVVMKCVQFMFSLWVCL